jgi:trehalose 6-phosphate phosphatase
MINDLARGLGEKLARGRRLWLFLDYDGTLAEFAPTPDIILPDPELIELLTRLAKFPDVLRVVILSGRQASAVRVLLPVPGILISGTYGVEFITWEGEEMHLLDIETAQSFLNQLKRAWEGILAGQEGFYLEDKGYSLALHARFAEPNVAVTVLEKATAAAKTVITAETDQHAIRRNDEDDLMGSKAFRILGGDRFLEVAPMMANKGQSVITLLEQFPWSDADILYIGDDDKDEEAFQVVTQKQGIAILVSEVPRKTAAQYRIKSPQKVRTFLRALLASLEPH